MKSLLTLSLITLSLAVASCKKSADVDPRDQYLGTYSVSVNSVTGYVNLGTPTTSNTTNDVLVVSKESDPKQLAFSFSQGRFTAQMGNGSSFTILPMSVPTQTSKGEKYSIGYTGDGAFSESSISCNIAYQYTVSGNTAKSINAIKGTKK